MSISLGRFAVLLTAGVLLSSAVAPAQKDRPRAVLDAIGEPRDFHRGETVRYALWHDQHGWHLRTTTREKKHGFKGTIEVEGGTLERVHSFRLEKEGRLADHWKLGPQHRCVTFDFETDGGIDGINFRVSKEAKSLRFNLHIDGKHERERIYIGQGGQHPRNDPFTLPAHPVIRPK
ncbi:MAG TPA: hypothetical protein VKD72_25245 [Gemmataceae bacterium]|nr:hypothetical protein [Gemmataceae bacterium]